MNPTQEFTTDDTHIFGHKVEVSHEKEPIENQPVRSIKPGEIVFLDRLTYLLDEQFKIGLIPGVGDVVSFVISGMTVFAMTRKGVSHRTRLKMVGNILLDLIVGSIPVLGDVFDVLYKANRRNLKLLKKEHGLV